MSKLTLSINQDTIDNAKEYAKSNGKSLSSIVEAYLKSLTNTGKSERNKTPHEIVSELRGSIEMPQDFTSYNDLLEDALLEKYLKK